MRTTKARTGPFNNSTLSEGFHTIQVIQHNNILLSTPVTFRVTDGGVVLYDTEEHYNMRTFLFKLTGKQIGCYKKCVRIDDQPFHTFFSPPTVKRVRYCMMLFWPF